jgi:hypothetical protein
MAPLTHLSTSRHGNVSTETSAGQPGRGNGSHALGESANAGYPNRPRGMGQSVLRPITSSVASSGFFINDDKSTYVSVCNKSTKDYQTLVEFWVCKITNLTLADKYLDVLDSNLSNLYQCMTDGECYAFMIDDKVFRKNSTGSREFAKCI